MSISPSLGKVVNPVSNTYGSPVVPLRNDESKKWLLSVIVSNDGGGGGFTLKAGLRLLSVLKIESESVVTEKI